MNGEIKSKKAEFFCVKTMKAYRVGVGIASLMLKFGNRWR